MFIGIDTHKDTLAVAACDPSGQLAEWLEVANGPAGFDAVAALVAVRGVARVGIEGSGHFDRAVAAFLAEAGSMCAKCRRR